MNLEQTESEDVIGPSDQSGFSRTATYRGVNASQQATFDVGSVEGFFLNENQLTMHYQSADQYQGQLGYNNVPSTQKLKTPGLSDVQSVNSTTASDRSLSRVSLQSESNGSNHLQSQSLLSRLSDPILPHAPSHPSPSLPEVTPNEDSRFQPSIWYRLGMKPPSLKK